MIDFVFDIDIFLICVAFRYLLYVHTKSFAFELKKIESAINEDYGNSIKHFHKKQNLTLLISNHKR